MSGNCCESSCNCGDNIPDHKMCMMSQPSNKFDVKKVMNLTSAPKYFCKCCGRTANEEANLCNPIKLTSEGK